MIIIGKTHQYMIKKQLISGYKAEHKTRIQKCDNGIQ